MLEGRDSVLSYNYEMQLPAGVSEEYRRSSYIHPIWDLNGTVITDDFPEDHYHHRGLSWMWPRVVVDGQTHDLWHIKGIRQRFEQWLGREATAELAAVGVQNGWYVEDRKVLEERVRIKVHAAEEAGRAVDVALTLEALEPVQLLGQENQDKGYGGLSFRLAPREETIITSPKGQEEDDSDHKRYVWADESGRFRGSSQASGVAIFQHPDNPSAPANWTLRHYGFLGVAWPGNTGHQLTPGEPLTLKYRLWIHKDVPQPSNLAQRYKTFQKNFSLDQSKYADK